MAIFILDELINSPWKPNEFSIFSIISLLYVLDPAWFAYFIEKIWLQKNLQ